MNIVNICGKIQQIRRFPNVTYATIYCKDGKQNEFLDVTIFNNEFFNKYFSKGQWIAITGHLHNNKYDDKFRIEIIVDRIGFAGNKETEEFPNVQLTPEEEAALPW